MPEPLVMPPVAWPRVFSLEWLRPGWLVNMTEVRPSEELTYSDR